MDWSAIWTELPKAIGPFVGTVVGGLLAIIGGVVGGFVGPNLTHRYTRMRETEKLFREKAEQLVQALYEHRGWLDEKRAAWLFRHSEHEVPSPLDRALAIQRLYFPTLYKPLDALEEEAIKYIQFLIAERQEQIRDMEAWLARADDSAKKFGSVYGGYRGAWGKALNAIVTEVRTRLGT